MKILHINYYGSEGGTGGAIATRRLHYGLRGAGIDSNILCVQGANESLHTRAYKLSRIEKRLDSLFRKITPLFSLSNLDGLFTYNIKKNNYYREADIVHFQRIYNFVSFLLLPVLTKKKPAIITFHDTWAYTGNCYAIIGCDRWKTGCGECPNPNIFPRLKRDHTHLEWKLKKWAYDHSRFTIVSLSKLQTEQIKQSILGHFPVHHIPTGIDTNLYQPLDREQCRYVLGLPKNKKVLMFMSESVDNYIKGLDLLLHALQSLPEALKSEIVLLLIGNKGESVAKSTDIEIYYLGYINSDRVKAAAYSAADLFVSPTRAEIFSLAILESLACGTPIVSFDVGGVPDIVRPGTTGYLAKAEDSKDLAQGIVQLFEDNALRTYMKQQCREIAIKEYPVELQVQRHLGLYQKLLIQ